MRTGGAEWVGFLEITAANQTHRKQAEPTRVHHPEEALLGALWKDAPHRPQPPHHSGSLWLTHRAIGLGSPVLEPRMGRVLD
jgi:hypothetical protein